MQPGKGGKVCSRYIRFDGESRWDSELKNPESNLGWGLVILFPKLSDPRIVVYGSCFMDVCIKVSKIDEVFMRLDGPDDMMIRVFERFSFFVPKYIFDPRYKAGVWDGQIHLLRSDRTMYVGLIGRLEAFCIENGWEFEAQWDYKATLDFSPESALQFAQRVIHQEGLVPYDYQLTGFMEAVRRRRLILLSPTASGKSLIIYLIAWFVVAVMGGSKVLIVVPLRQLVSQLIKDFSEFSGGRTDGMMCEVEGKKTLASEINEKVVITTWHAVYKQPASWFEQFSGIVGDEVHRFKASSLKSLMEKLGGCPFRVGLTGSMDRTETNEMVLEGLFGPPMRLATTRDLQNRGIIAKSQVRAVVLKHPKARLKTDLYNYDPSELTGSEKYEREIQYLAGCEPRNSFLCHLTLSLLGNTLVLFERVEAHGAVIFERLVKERPDNTFFIHGGVDVKLREQVKAKVEASDQSITVASLGTFSTGINIKRLNNIVFAFVGKAPITLLQSIGRGLRVAADKRSCLLVDIADDLRLTSRSSENYTLRHFKERIAIYQDEKHPVSVSTVALV